MFAQLGKTVFQTLKSFGEFSEQGTANYAEHNLLDGKPRLQRTGSTLNELSIKILFHNAFCVPQDELNSLKDSRDNGEIMPLIWGNGNIEGDFVITDLQATKDEVAPNGTLFACSVSLTLKEYISPNKIQDEQANNRSKAKAVGNKKPVAKKKLNPSPCATLIASIVNKIANHAAQISAIILEQNGGGSTIGRNLILHHLSAIRLLVEDLLRRCDDPNSCANGNPNLKYRAEQVFKETNNFNYEVANRNIPQYPAENQIMAAVVRNLKTAANELITQSITRK
jgi:phage protein U